MLGDISITGSHLLEVSIHVDFEIGFLEQSGSPEVVHDLFNVPNDIALYELVRRFAFAFGFNCVWTRTDSLEFVVLYGHSSFRNEIGKVLILHILDGIEIFECDPEFVFGIHVYESDEMVPFGNGEVLL